MKISEADADARLLENPSDIVALVAKGDARLELRDHRAANAYYSAAVSRGRIMRSAKDEVRRDVDRATRAIGQLAEVFKQHLLQSLNAAGHTNETRHPRFQASLEMMLGERPRPLVQQQYPQSPSLYYHHDLPYVQFADPAFMPWVDAFQQHFAEIKQEAQLLLSRRENFEAYVKSKKDRPQHDAHGLLNNDDWSTLYLWNNGEPASEVLTQCPATYQAIVDHVPLCEINHRAPSVMLSLLKPGAHIPAHTGMLNPRYICHLPIIIPPDCYFRVGNNTRQWNEGKVIIFDDTVEHEARNNSDQDRLVLIFDIWRPELTADEQKQISALFTAVDSY